MTSLLSYATRFSRPVIWLILTWLIPGLYNIIILTLYWGCTCWPCDRVNSIGQCNNLSTNQNTDSVTGIDHFLNVSCEAINLYRIYSVMKELIKIRIKREIRYKEELMVHMKWTCLERSIRHKTILCNDIHSSTSNKHIQELYFSHYIPLCCYSNWRCTWILNINYTTCESHVTHILL